MIDAFLLFFACVCLLVALGALYALAKWSVSYGRFEMDLTSKAFNLRRAIDEAVEQRVVVANTHVPQRPPKPGMQPRDPNVRESRILDEVAEMEREANRVMNADNEYEKRDRAYRMNGEAVEL